MRQNRVPAAVLAATLVVGCTGGGGGIVAQDPDVAEEAAQPGDETDADAAAGFADGPAPAATMPTGAGRLALRVDEVERGEVSLRLALRVLAVDELRWDDAEVRLLTDSGVELPRAASQVRTIAANSMARVEFTIDGFDDGFGRLTLDTLGVRVDLPVPEVGSALRWRPAPLRQVGFDDLVLRDGSEMQANVYTLRTEGMVTEVTFLAMVSTTANSVLCRAPSAPCLLEDAAGNQYPLLGQPYEFPRTHFAHVRGTLRFAGELPADERSFRLVLSGTVAAGGTPMLQHDVELPSAADTELHVAAGVHLPEPFDVDQTAADEDTGLQMEFGEMGFFEDRVQLDVRVTAERDQLLNLSGLSSLRDAAGNSHALAVAGGQTIELDGGETTDLTLVFVGRIVPGTDAVDLTISARGGSVQATIPIPGN